MHLQTPRSRTFTVTGDVGDEDGKEGELLEALDEAGPTLFAKALSLCDTRDEAEDLFQEMLYNAYESLDQYDQGSNMKGWLFTILKNEHRNKYRRESRRNEYKNDERDTLEFYNHGPDPKTPEEVFDLSNIDERIKGAIRDVNQKFRNVLLLVCLMDFSYKEAAYILDRPIGTIMSRLYRARREFKEILKKKFPDYVDDMEMLDGELLDRDNFR